MQLNSFMQKIDVLSETVQVVCSSVQRLMKEERIYRRSRNLLAIHGVPEDEDEDRIVERVLSVAGLHKQDYAILYRLGRPREDGCPRLLKLKLHDGVRMPFFKELAQKLQDSPSLSSYSVRKYATPAELKVAYEARQEKRRRESSISPETVVSASEEEDYEVKIANNLKNFLVELQTTADWNPLTYECDPNWLDDLIAFYATYAAPSPSS